MTNSRTILVTGVNGFVGHHVVDALHSAGHTVVGVGHQADIAPALQDKVAHYSGCDLTRQEAVQALDLQGVDAIIHLAGLAHLGSSFDQPQQVLNANSAMVTFLCERALAQQVRPRLVMVSSGAVYDPEQPMPLTEESQTTPTSPYAVSKLACELLCSYYRRRGLQCVVARPFNHTGPGQGPGFLIPDLTQNIITAGEGGVVHTGTLTSQRDYSDARDVAQAYMALATATALHHDLYNICSGQSYAGQEVLALICQAAFGNPQAVTAETDPAKIRPLEPPNISASNERLRTDCGWEPRYNLEQTIHDYVTWYQNAHRH